MERLKGDLAVMSLTSYSWVEGNAPAKNQRLSSEQTIPAQYHAFIFRVIALNLVVYLNPD